MSNATPNLKPIDPSTADASIAASLAAVKAKLGSVPNMFLTLAHTPVALNGYLQLSAATAGGKLSARQREAIALAVAEQNSCGYCLAAHNAIGGMVGLTPADIAAARDGRATNARDAALVELAADITAKRGNLTAGEVASYRAKGLSEADILEVLTNVALNILTNYVNHVAATEIDFPAVPLKKAA